VILENRHIDDHGALAGQNLRDPDARRAPRCLLILETRLVAAVAADLVGIGVGSKAASLQEVVILVPDQNVSGLDANLLQPFGNGHRQRMVRTDSLAA